MLVTIMTQVDQLPEMSDCRDIRKAQKLSLYLPVQFQKTHDLRHPCTTKAGYFDVS